jgi:uncharacterized protein (DUF2141 family)
MKIILAITMLFALAPAPVVLAQQTGSVPMAPPPRSAPVVPAAPPATPSASPATSAPAAGTDAGAAATVAPPPAVVPSRSIVPPTQSGRPSRSDQGTLLVEIETTQTTGRIAVAIYRDAESFRRSENPVRSMMLPRRGNLTSAFVANLPPGRYVIAAFQDSDGDGKLSKNRLGIPREPFGFSNGARARFGPPPFEAAAFDLTPAGATQRVVLRGVF